MEQLNDVVAASQKELEAIDEIGPEVAHSVVAFFEIEENQQVVNEIWEAGLTLTNPYAGEREQSLEGLTFVFTGELDRWTCDQVQRYVEQLGARATSTISGQTDYVVSGPNAGSKLEEARDRGVPVLDEGEFLELVEKRR